MAKKYIEEVEYAKLNFLKNLFGTFPLKVFEGFPAKVLFTGTARAALRIILEYLTKKGILLNKNDQVLVPQWLCQSVFHTMHRFCFPSLSMNSGTKGLLVYHQYGFPQNMDEICNFCEEKGLFLIEDCANVYESYYKGKALGTFGIGAIFSFSKLFPSILGGALVTNDNYLSEFGRQRIKNSNHLLPCFTYGNRIIFESLKDTHFNPVVSKLQEMVYGITDYSLDIKNISLRIISKQLLDNAMQRRKDNYQFILRYFADRPEYFKGLERDGVIPYVVPLFDKITNLERMLKRLNEKNVITGIYHFDTNRNLLKPNFQKCLWIPVHQGLNKTNLEMICETIKKAVN